MSKYIIEIEEKPLCVFDKDTQTFFPRLWRVKGFNSLVFDEDGLSRLEVLNSDYINEHYGQLQQDAYDKGYKDGRNVTETQAHNDAYQRGFEDGKAVHDKGCEGCKYANVAGTHEPCVRCSNSYPNQWTAKDDKIEVGDEVEWDNDFTGDRFIVTRIYQPYGKKEQCDGIDDDGDVYRAVLIESLVKTGRHFDIASILEDMRND